MAAAAATMVDFAIYNREENGFRLNDGVEWV